MARTVSARPKVRRSARLGVAGVGAAVLGAALAGPASAATTQTVHHGDTLGSLARENGVSLRSLLGANPDVSNPDLILAGSRLVIPTGHDAGAAPSVVFESHASHGVHKAHKHSHKRAGHAVKRHAKHHAKRIAKQQNVASSYRTASVKRTHRADNVSGGVWDRLAQCESGGNWNISTGNGFYGGLQFTQSSWRAAGGTGSPHNASKGEQIAAAKKLQKMQGWGAWPVCSKKVGLR